MHAWESIQKTLEIIENRIGEEITIEELANAAALSPFYYQRLFSRLVKKPAKEYIKLRRLAEACEALRGCDNRILDIALDYGFGSHETFTRAFKDAYGMSPTEYRQSDVKLNNFDKPDLLLNYTMIELGAPLMSDGLVLEINRCTLDKPIDFVGIKGDISIKEHFPNGKKTGIDNSGEIWRAFHEISSKIKGKPASRNLGVAYGDHDTPKGCFSYFAGKEAGPETINTSFQTWTLPAAE